MACPDSELSLVITDDEEISRLNQEYLGRSGPTNVISFPMQEGDFSDVNPDVLGDVVISADTILVQAEELGYTPEEMLDFFLIHGILHLVGYDHMEEEDAAEMEAKARQMWALIGYQ